MSARFFGIATRFYEYSHTVGRREYVGAGFSWCMDFTRGGDGTIYVISRSGEYRPDGLRITMCTIDEEYLGDFGRHGKGKGEFIWPTSITHDKEGNLYISDDYLHRISIFNSKGEFLDHWGTLGSGDGEINKPSGLEFDKEDNLYLSDSANHRIQVFSKDGKFLAKWGSEGNGEEQLNLPWGVTIDQKGDVWVADWRNDRVQKFTADGDFLASFGTSGEMLGQLNHPTDVAIDKDGDFYVSDWGNDRVQAFTPDGRFITAFTGDSDISKWGWDKLNANPDMIKQRALLREDELEVEKHFRHPTAVDVDDQQRILMLDCNRHRLQVYQKTS